MSNQIVITSGAKLRDLDDVIIGTDGILSSVAFNVANGVPRLDENGKILVSQLPNSVMEFKGVWNAATNTPTLANGTGNAGDVWLCNVAGTVNFGAGPIAFAVGDYAVYTGTVWARSSGATGTVTSVGVSRDGNALVITGSPVTSSGTINLGFSGDNNQYINAAGNLTTIPTLITSIGLTMPAAFGVSNSPLTANGTIGVTALGYPSQYIRGDGTLADFPTSGGGGSSVSYYLNGGTSQGTIGGTTYYEMSKTADTGTGVDFSKSGDGLITAFLTDAGDPALLQIPAGNWNYEIYASMSANGGTPQMYAELYVYNGTTFTLISTSSNEILYDGTNLNLYTFAMTVPQTVLTVTDRLAIKLYATNSGGKTTTVHTQDSHLCQVITTFTTGITALNGLTAQVQYFGTGTSGSDFNIVSSVDTHTFNLPNASATKRGALSAADWYTFNNKQDYITAGTTLQYWRGDKTWQTLNTSVVPELTNLYFTNARARTAISLTTTGSTGASTYDNSTGVLNIPNYADQYVGTVTSVGLSAPTGFSVTGSPVTTSGTLALSFATGYSLPTNVKQSNWDDAYTWVAAFPTQTGNSGKFLTTDGSSLSWAANPLGTVTSVAMTVPTGLSIAGSPITTSGTLAVTLTAGYSIPTNASQTTWDTAYTNRITSLTTTGTSGAATLVSNVLNIPQYQAALTNPVTGAGTGVSGQVAFFTGTNTIDGESNLFWDSSNNRLKVGAISSTYGITSENGLQVGDGSGSAINFNSNSGYQAYIRVAGNDRITIVSTTGRVGINTTNVNASLEVKSTTANEGSLRLYNTINNASTTWGLEWFRDYDSGSNSDAAYIKYKREGGFAGALIFGVGSFGSVSTALTINSSRNVAIGTDTATAKLQIANTSAGAATVGAFLLNESGTINTEVRLAFAANVNNDIATNRYSYISALNTSGSNGQALIFATNSTGNSAVERLRITDVGNIGINSNNPVAVTNFTTLTINGNTNSLIALQAAGTTYGRIQANSTTFNFLMGNGMSTNFYSNAGSDTLAMTILSNGFVGINNSSPFARLTVDANIGSARSFSSSSIPNIFLRDTTTSGINVGGAITFAGYKSAAGATGLFAVISGQKENGIDTDEKGAFVVYTSYTAGGSFRESFRVKSDGVLNSSNYGGGGNRVIYTDNAGNYIAATVGTGLSLSGGVLSATGGGSGTVSGTGSSGYIAKWSGTSAIANSNIYDDGTNVIVAGTTPTSSFRFTAYSTTANNTTVIPTWPYYDMGSQTMTRKIASFTDGGNGGTSTAGTGTTALIEIGQYYSGRGVIQMSSSGGSSPSDQGTGRGKDLLIIAGQSDNGAGYVGGRLYLQGGSGYSSGYGVNYGSVIMQSLGGLVGIGGAPSYTLDVNGDIRAQGNLRVTSSGSGLYLSGNNNRIYFTNYRAMEGDTTGTVLQIGESYATTQIFNTLKISGNSNDSPRLNMFGATYQIIGMGDRTSSAGTDIGYMQIFNQGTTVMDFNGDSGGFSFINAGNLVIGSSSQIYSSAKLQVNGDLYVSGSSFYAGGVTYSGIQTFNNLVYLNSTTTVATYQEIRWKGVSGLTYDFSMGNGGYGMYILSSAEVDLNAPIGQRYGLFYTFKGNGSSAYNVNIFNSGVAADELQFLGGLKLNTTTCGFVPPKMTTTQKNALIGSVKVAGCIVYDTTSNLLQCWNGSTWNNLW